MNITINPEYIMKIDRPTSGNYHVEEVIKHLKAFKGHVIIQTMFMKGEGVDNTGDEYVNPWLEVIKDIQPRQVMIYTIDRETPDKHLQKATHAELDTISDRVMAMGISCTASY